MKTIGDKTIKEITDKFQEKTVDTFSIGDSKFKVTIERISNDLCLCGCGKPVSGRSKYYNQTCRQRACRSRKRLAKLDKNS